MLREGYTRTALNTVARFMGFDLKDSHMFMGALPGEGIVGEGAQVRARKMGQALFGQARQAGKGECPTCWSDIWKFSQAGTAVCPICGQTAGLVVGDNEVRWVYNNSSDMFTKNQLKHHFQEWLVSKVQEFISRRKELAAVRDRYKGMIPSKDVAKDEG